MKSGSTTLHELLAEHPAICMSEPKEPCFFVDPAVLRERWPEMWSMGFWRDEAAYLRLFEGKPEAVWRGESSTDYSKRPRFDGVAERIAAYSPDARIIYIMRDPVKRSMSHYWHMVEHRGETRAPLAAILEDPHYAQVSHYAMQLRPYLEKFGATRVLSLTFEGLVAEPLQTVKQVYEWLGVDAGFVPPDPRSARNRTPDEVRQQRKGTQLLRAFRHSSLWNSIGQRVPKVLRRAGVAMLERQVQWRKVDTSAAEEHLRRLHRPQIDELTAMLGRSFPEWTT